MGVTVPLYSLTLIREGEAYFLIGNASERRKLGLFEDPINATSYLNENPRPDFSTVVIPNNEIADGFGLNFIPLVRSRDLVVMSNRITKFTCTTIGDGLY